MSKIKKTQNIKRNDSGAVYSQQFQVESLNQKGLFTVVHYKNGAVDKIRIHDRRNSYLQVKTAQELKDLMSILQGTISEIERGQ